jgi:hypothetical protein
LLLEHLVSLALIEVAGFQRLRLRPFDPSRDTLTEHEQTDARLLAMFGQLDTPEFDTEDVRAFCRLFAACVRAAQMIMFEKTFMRGSRVSEAEFHNELERLLRNDPELEGRLTRRDAVAGGASTTSSMTTSSPNSKCPEAPRLPSTTAPATSASQLSTE